MISVFQETSDEPNVEGMSPAMELYQPAGGGSVNNDTREGKGGNQLSDINSCHRQDRLLILIKSLHGGIEVRAKRVARRRTNRDSGGLSDATYAYRYGSLVLRNHELPGV